MTGHQDAHPGASAAIKAVGSSAKLARALGIRKEAVWQWQARGVPPIRVPEVARITGLAPHVIRPDMPDLFPPPDIETAGARDAGAAPPTQERAA